jgi:hypothetical protein
MKRIVAILLLAASTSLGVEIDGYVPPTPVVDTVSFDLTWEDGSQEGRLQWNNDDGTLEVGLPGGNVNLQIGLESLMRVSNKSGATITNGTPVYVSGAQGSRPTVAPANASVLSKSFVCGVATEDIANNSNGYVATFGYVRDIDTSAWVAGTKLYLADIDGGLTNAIPDAPSEPMCVAVVLVSNTDSGVILTKPSSALSSSLVSERFAVITDTNTVASASNAGRTRYYTSGNNSYIDVCMQTNASNYAWINIQSYGW